MLSLLTRWVSKLCVLLLLRRDLIAASIIGPITYLLIANAIDLDTHEWTLLVHYPPSLGFARIYLDTGKTFVPLHSSNTITDPNGYFCTFNNCPQLDHADLRILISDEPAPSHPVTVNAQFISI